MKGTTKHLTAVQSVTYDSELLDCSCEILNDSGLSDVSSNSCDCSECLQANLNAFNALRQMQEEEEQREAQKTRAKTRNKQRSGTQKGSKNNQEISNENRNTINRHKSSQNKHTRPIRKYQYQDNEENDSDYEEREEFLTQEELNDFLYITRNRTRKYIQRRKKLEEADKEQKNKLKEKIKMNLEILKITAQEQLENAPVNSKPPQYLWNHSTYQCLCNGNKSDKAGHIKQCCREPCRKIKKSQPLDTNLNKIFKNQFSENRDVILQGLKRERLQAQKPSQQLCPYDKCLNHHNRTSEQKIRKIKKFINQQVKKYKENARAKEDQKEEQKNVRNAKLRAIDIKSKQILKRTIKHDPAASRTSFKLSIDNFDTFSEMREEQARRKQIKNAQKKIKEEMAMGGQNLENKIYENLEGEEDDHEFQMPQKIKRQTEGLKKQDLGMGADEGYSQRILYDAKIKDPKNLKKIEKSVASKQIESKKRELSKTKELERQRDLQKEIEKKKKQIMNEYSKRNAGKKPVQNKKIREEYQKSKTNLKEGPKSKGSMPHNPKDPYHKTYKHQAGKKIEQINIHGDPLLQQYVHHDGKRLQGVAKVRSQYGAQKEQVFTQNINSLTGKTRLKL